MTSLPYACVVIFNFVWQIKADFISFKNSIYIFTPRYIKKEVFLL